MVSLSDVLLIALFMTLRSSNKFEGNLLDSSTCSTNLFLTYHFANGSKAISMAFNFILSFRHL